MYQIKQILDCIRDNPIVAGLVIAALALPRGGAEGQT